MTSDIDPVTHSSSRTSSAGTETWLPVPWYEGRYAVSDQGRVLSIPRDNRPRRVLRPYVQQGYERITLWNHGDRVDAKVHQLVLLAFVGPRPKGQLSRHLNGNRSDNRLVNLAWGTPSENMYDAVEHGTHRNAAKTHCKAGHAFVEHGVVVDLPSKDKPFRQCAVCRSAKRKTAPKYRARPIFPGDGDPRHGSQAGYQHHCRCDPCRLAHNEHKRVSRRRVRDRARATEARAA